MRRGWQASAVRRVQHAAAPSVRSSLQLKAAGRCAVAMDANRQHKLAQHSIQTPGSRPAPLTVRGAMAATAASSLWSSHNRNQEASYAPCAEMPPPAQRPAPGQRLAGERRPARRPAAAGAAAPLAAGRSPPRHLRRGAPPGPPSRRWASAGLCKGGGGGGRGWRPQGASLAPLADPCDLFRPSQPAAADGRPGRAPAALLRHTATRASSAAARMLLNTLGQLCGRNCRGWRAGPDGHDMCLLSTPPSREIAFLAGDSHGHPHPLPGTCLPTTNRRLCAVSLTTRCSCLLLGLGRGASGRTGLGGGRHHRQRQQPLGEDLASPGDTSLQHQWRMPSRRRCAVLGWERLDEARMPPMRPHAGARMRGPACGGSTQQGG